MLGKGHARGRIKPRVCECLRGHLEEQKEQKKKKRRRKQKVEGCGRLGNHPLLVCFLSNLHRSPNT